MIGLILAGGRGTRLSSVVPDKPKPMADVMGHPFLSYQLEYLIFQGIKQVYISIGYLGEQIKNFYGNKYKNLEVFYIQEVNLLGTGGAIRYAVQEIQKKIKNLASCLILNGDTFCNLDLNLFKNFFIETQADIAIGLVCVENTSRYGAVVLDAQHKKIQTMGEKTQTGPGWINAGVYLISPKIMHYLLNIPEEVFSWETAVLMPAKSLGFNLFGFCSEAKFIDIGIPEDYQKSQILLPQWMPINLNKN